MKLFLIYKRSDSKRECMFGRNFSVCLFDGDQKGSSISEGIGPEQTNASVQLFSQLQQITTKSQTIHGSLLFCLVISFRPDSRAVMILLVFVVQPCKCLSLFLIQTIRATILMPWQSLDSLLLGSRLSSDGPIQALMVMVMDMDMVMDME